MREIKFRGWDSYNKIMITPYCELRDDNHFWGEDLVNTGLQTPIAVMQYTGLKDKNGKEIYEGDIVKTWIIGSVNEWKHEEIFEVSSISCSYVIKNNRRNRPLAKYADEKPLNEFFEVEVIGNIYENPELLEEVKK